MADIVDELAVEALGVHFQIQVEDGGLRTTLSAVLCDLRRSPAGDHEGHVPPPAERMHVTGHGPFCVESSTGRRFTAETPAAAVARVLAGVNLHAVESTPMLACHAAVLTRNGRTLVLPGRSGLGKTTLTSALLLEGWAYVSDEALAVPWTTGPPMPYQRPLSLSPWSRAELALPQGYLASGEHLLRPSDFGAELAAHVGPVSDVVLLRRSADVDAPRMSAVHRQEALREIMARGFTSIKQPARALIVFADLLTHAHVRRVDVGRPRDTARLIGRNLR